MREFIKDTTPKSYLIFYLRGAPRWRLGATTRARELRVDAVRAKMADGSGASTLHLAAITADHRVIRCTEIDGLIEISLATRTGTNGQVIDHRIIVSGQRHELTLIDLCVQGTLPRLR